MNGQNKPQSIKDFRIKREAKALQKNIAKRKKQKELLEKAKEEKQNGQN